MLQFFDDKTVLESGGACLKGAPGTGLKTTHLGDIYTQPFLTKSRKRFMHFGHSFTQQQRFGGLKMQTFENGFKSKFVKTTLGLPSTKDFSSQLIVVHLSY